MEKTASPTVLALWNSASGESHSFHARCLDLFIARSNLANALSSSDASDALSDTLSLTRTSA
eukprot:CAMPEP_0173458094 /NCGR_PEP_ID=MMETSP1357-20121228/58937_1 /TAXON_ID=77926 /ORGANISM="Hemiselmis rufescens, Strain PCC563" /LENGTH=61 /DNA_ID=CAMNT_0014425435 /DNA_START=26 /DNA_END=211 /DNA_ORIENTATION=-